ncbi:MAG TPA: SCO family protein [Streptosporangiaceae bacterium]|nr:SCO family protein [Streptosporangiaceae bacterium]
MNVNDPAVVAAFKSALLHQGLIALLIFAVLGFAWLTAREWLRTARRGGGAAQGGGDLETSAPGSVGGAARAAGKLVISHGEPAWRQVLRLGFGILWVFDGILQAQPKMAIGLPSQVIEPIAATSPHWVQQVVNWAGTSWSYHPMQAGASAVWIQVGIGIWMITAPRGLWSRLAGVAGAFWGLVVWVFGESFGGIFAPGLTWLFGAPGAVLIYAVAGILIALPERAWYSPRLRRGLLDGTGLFLVGMAVLQAWPGRGFWQGRSQAGPSGLAAMTHAMSQTSQPSFVASLVNAFTTFDQAHAFAVNLFAVVALAVIGVAFLTGNRRAARPAVIAFVVLCLADWVFVEDLGFLGGLGTDPNSMLPFALLALAGYLALTHAPEPAAVPATSGAGLRTWRALIRPASVRLSLGRASLDTIASVGAVGLIFLGAAPMAVAQASRNADPILAESIAGSAAALNFTAKPFRLTDQRGRVVSLASLRGKAVLLTFLDPVCTSDCPLIAQELRAAGQLLGTASRQVELVAVVANPVYHQVADTQAFDRQEHLNTVPNWLYLTGSVPQLKKVWSEYGVSAQILPGGSMIGHPDIAYVIDGAGRVREELNTNPGPGTTATKSSFAVVLADAARKALGAS